MPEIDIYQDSRGRGRCRSCGAPVEWAEVVKTGKRMPFDDGLVVLRTQGGILEGQRVVETVDTGVFVAMFCKSHKGCTPATRVTRIQFRYVDGTGVGA